MLNLHQNSPIPQSMSESLCSVDKLSRYNCGERSAIDQGGRIEYKYCSDYNVTLRLILRSKRPIKSGQVETETEEDKRIKEVWMEGRLVTLPLVTAFICS